MKERIKKPASKNTFGKNVGTFLRGAASGVASIPDLLTLPVRLGMDDVTARYLQERGTPFLGITGSQMAEDAFDNLTRRNFVPESSGQRIVQTVGEFLGSGAAGNRLLKAGNLRPVAAELSKKGKIGKKLAEALFKVEGKKGYITLAGAGVGAGLAKEADPEGIAAPLIGGLLGGAATHGGIGLGQSFLANKAFRQANLNVGPEMARDVIGDVVPPKGEGLREPFDELTRNAMQEREAVSELYNTARENAAPIPQGVLREATNNINRNLRFSDDVIPELVPGLQGITGELRKIGGMADASALLRGNAQATPELMESLSRYADNVMGPEGEILVPTLGQVEGARQALAHNIENARTQGLKTGQMKTARNRLDQELEAAAEAAGNEEFSNSLEQFKRARQGHAEFQDKFGEGHNTDIGQNFIARQVDRNKYGREVPTGEMLFQETFGNPSGTGSGFSIESTPKVRALKERLSPEQFENVKKEFTTHILAPMHESNLGVEGGEKFPKVWQDIKRNNSSLLKEFMTPGEINGYDRLSKNYEKLAETTKIPDWVKKLPYIRQFGSLLERVNYLPTLGQTAQSLAPQGLVGPSVSVAAGNTDRGNKNRRSRLEPVDPAARNNGKKSASDPSDASSRDLSSMSIEELIRLRNFVSGR